MCKNKMSLNYQIYQNFYFIIICCAKLVLCKESTILQTRGNDEKLVSSNGNYAEKIQCSSNELRQISNNYEVCHREKVEKIEQQFITRVGKG